MRTRLRALHWRDAGRNGLVYASIGVVLVALFGSHDSTAFIVFGGQAVVWTAFALTGRGGAGLIGVRSGRQESDWPRPPLKWRTFLIGLVLYGLVGAGSLAEAVVHAARSPAFSIVLVVNAVVVAVMIAVTYRRMLPRRRDDIII